MMIKVITALVEDHWSNRVSFVYLMRSNSNVVEVAQGITRNHEFNMAISGKSFY